MPQRRPSNHHHYERKTLRQPASWEASLVNANLKFLTDLMCRFAFHDHTGENGLEL